MRYFDFVKVAGALVVAPILMLGTYASPALSQGVIENYAPVTDAMLADPAPGDWLSYGRNVMNYRFSPLSQITRENVGSLQLIWARAMEPGINQSAPLVHDGVMFVPNPFDVIQALDASNGDLIWEHRRELPEMESIMHYGERKRGISLYDDRLFFVSWDNHVVALDATTGAQIWEADRSGQDEGITNSTGPVVANGVVVAGSTCQQAIRSCYVTGHDVETGKELWRNAVIPRPGEPGDETWGGRAYEDRWCTGVWGQISYDPQTNLVHYGSSGICPGSETERNQPGATIFGTNTRFAVRPRTGEVVWAHQVLPRDNWDQECTFEMMPVTTDVNPNADEMLSVGPGAQGTDRRVLLGVPCKTGTMWALDAEDGEFLWARDTSAQTLIESIDEKGVVTVDEDKILATFGEPVDWCPSHSGGRDWPPSSYNPETNTFFIPYINVCQQSTPLATPRQRGENYNVAQTRRLAPGAEFGGTVHAIDATTGETLWKWNNRALTYSPTSLTAGGLLLTGGFDRYLRALDQETGEVLWRTRLASQAQGHAFSYEVNGVQYIAVTAGGGRRGGYANLVVTPGVDAIDGSNAVYVFALPGNLGLEN